jgi:hypothetical protein
MRTIQEPRLSVEQIPDHSGQRKVRVSYQLVTGGPDDSEFTPLVTERIVVHGIDFHDAPVEPTTTPLLVNESTYAATTGTIERVYEQTLNRDELDVERDWWSTDLDGSVQPIAEWVDHIVAEIHVAVDGRVIDEARTAVVTGSWGALGPD